MTPALLRRQYVAPALHWLLSRALLYAAVIAFGAQCFIALAGFGRGGTWMTFLILVEALSLGLATIRGDQPASVWERIKLEHWKPLLLSLNSSNRLLGLAMSVCILLALSVGVVDKTTVVRHASTDAEVGHSDIGDGRSTSTPRLSAASAPNEQRSGGTGRAPTMPTGNSLATQSDSNWPQPALPSPHQREPAAATEKAPNHAADDIDSHRAQLDLLQGDLLRDPMRSLPVPPISRSPSQGDVQHDPVGSIPPSFFSPRLNSTPLRGLPQGGVRTTAEPPEVSAKGASCEQYRPSYGTTLGTTFMTGSAELNPQVKRQLDALGEALTSPDLAGGYYVIEGHADTTGGEAFNERLSLERAQAALRYLVSRYHVDANRFRVVGTGKHAPLVSTPDQVPEECNRAILIVRVDHLNDPVPRS